MATGRRENLRIADSLLREQLAIDIGYIWNGLEGCRETAVKERELHQIEEIGILVRRSSALEEMIRHAEQGYTGISADFRIE